MQQRKQMLTMPPENMIADGVLVEQALSGKQQAFEMRVDRYQPQLTRLICHMLGISRNDERVATILQETWLQFYRFLPACAAYSTLLPWLVHVTRNLCITELRRQQRHPLISFSELEKSTENGDTGFLETVLVDPHPLPEEVAELHELRSMLQQVFDQLPSQYQSVLFLRYNRQINLDEIGQKLKLSKKAVQNGLYRARLRFREVLFSDAAPPER